MSTLPGTRRVRLQGQENKVGDVAFISGRMLLLPSGPAVLFPRRALKLLKLTYYLLDWANMFVFCVLCGQVVALLHFPLHFNRIECSGVTVEECLTDYQHWVSFLYGNYCKLCVVKFVFFPPCCVY